MSLQSPSTSAEISATLDGADRSDPHDPRSAHARPRASSPSGQPAEPEGTPARRRSRRRAPLVDRHPSAEDLRHVEATAAPARRFGERESGGDWSSSRGRSRSRLDAERLAAAPRSASRLGHRCVAASASDVNVTKLCIMPVVTASRRWTAVGREPRRIRLTFVTQWVVLGDARASAGGSAASDSARIGDAYGFVPSASSPRYSYQ